MQGEETGVSTGKSGITTGIDGTIETIGVLGGTIESVGIQVDQRIGMMHLRPAPTGTIGITMVGACVCLIVLGTRPLEREDEVERPLAEGRVGHGTHRHRGGTLAGVTHHQMEMACISMPKNGKKSRFGWIGTGTARTTKELL